MRRSVGKLLTVCTLALAPSLLGVCAFAQHVMGDLRERALFLGPQLAGFAELVDRDTSLELNGHVLHLSTLTSERAVDALLARFAELCTGSAPRLTRELLAAAPSRAGGGDGVVLREALADGGGLATCLAPARDGGIASLLQSFLAYRASGDLSALGQLRFVHARRMPEGGSHVLFAFSEGPLRAQAMFPVRGDAAGRDFAGLPRPRGGRRVISAQVRGAAYGVVAHEVAGTPEEALARYLGELSGSGFRALPLTTEPAHRKPALAGIVRGEEHAVVHGFRHHEHTVIAVTRIGAHRLERATAAIASEESHVQ